MKNRDWRENVLKDFNQDENTYSAQIFEETNFDTLDKSARLRVLEDHFNLSSISSNDAQLRLKYDDMRDSLGLLINSKVKKWNANTKSDYGEANQLSSTDYQNNVLRARELYELRRSEYNQYLKNQANNSTSSNSNPAPEPSPAPERIDTAPKIIIKATPPEPTPPPAPKPKKKKKNNKKKKNKKKKKK